MMLNNSVQTDNQIVTTEKHIWVYDGALPKKMIKIKGNTDSTWVSFVKDDKGNIVKKNQSGAANHSLPCIIITTMTDD